MDSRCSSRPALPPPTPLTYVLLRSRMMSSRSNAVRIREKAIRLHKQEQAVDGIARRIQRLFRKNPSKSRALAVQIYRKVKGTPMENDITVSPIATRFCRLLLTVLFIISRSKCCAKC
jgi:hypothetical protein